MAKTPAIINVLSYSIKAQYRLFILIPIFSTRIVHAIFVIAPKFKLLTLNLFENDAALF
jgi:hypothetical protein